MIVVIAASLGGGGGGGSAGGSNGESHVKQGHTGAHAPKSYVVKSGDTLISIAHSTGVPVVRILKLNPGIDPQILIAGEELRLR